MRFDGVDVQPERDNPRLSGQLSRVWNLMKDGEWRTLRQISDTTHDPEASVSAQLRNLRKPRFGSHTILRRYVTDGLYEYALVVNRDLTPDLQPCKDSVMDQATLDQIASDRGDDHDLYERDHQEDKT